MARAKTIGASAGIIACVWLVAYLVPLAPTTMEGGISIEEGIRRVPEIISEGTTVYYSLGAVPDVKDKGAPLAALDLALRTWEESNPGLKFVHHEWSEIRIEWLKHGAVTHSGLATCQEAAIKNRCILEISIGGTGCSGRYIQAEHYLLANLIMHELGHALGIGHTSQRGHLMYSEADPEEQLDTRGYVIPAKHEDLEYRVSEYEKIITSEQERYDALYEQYRPYEGRALAGAEYEESVRLFAELASEQKRINAMIAEYNIMVEQLNSIAAVIPCPAG